MQLSNRQFTVLTVGSVLLACFLMAANHQGWFRSDPRSEGDQKEPASARQRPVDRDDVLVNGIRMSKLEYSDYKARQEADSQSDDRPRSRAIDWGQSPAVNPSKNANTQSVAEAFSDRENLVHRISSLAEPPPFDAEAYQADPQKYLDEVVPGRIKQSLQPGPDVASIRRKGRFFNTLLAGESLELSAKVDPGAPVTFHAPKLGTFQNGLTTITVRADENGIARAQFGATGGTHGEIEVLAASPVHSDQAQWLIEVGRSAKPPPDR